MREITFLHSKHLKFVNCQYLFQYYLNNFSQQIHGILVAAGPIRIDKVIRFSKFMIYVYNLLCLAS